MTIRDFYQAAGGSYEEAIGRLMTDARILKYLRKLPQMADYTDMINAIGAEDWETAFRASHNLKGMCLNLSLGRLAESSSALCETMRHGKPTVDITALTEQVKKDYAKVLAMIDTLEG